MIFYSWKTETNKLQIETITHERSKILESSEAITTSFTTYQSPYQYKGVEQQDKTKDSLKTWQDHRTSLAAHLGWYIPDFKYIYKKGISQARKSSGNFRAMYIKERSKEASQQEKIQ